MESVKTILSIVPEIYKLYKTVKTNKETCKIVLNLVESLEQLVESIKNMDTVHVTEDVERMLKEVVDSLRSGLELVKKCTKSNLLEDAWKANKRAEKLKILIERLDRGVRNLAFAMQVEQRTELWKIDEKVSRILEVYEAARMKDDKERNDIIVDKLMEQLKLLEEIKSKMENLMLLSRSQDNSVVSSIQMIKLDELEYDSEPFMKTPTSEVYKGKYRGFQVAIKRYIQPVNRNKSQIHAFFEREVITMKQFESPYILRMYGICVRDRAGANPQFLIVTEFCEKRSLRQVLDNTELSWVEKARMCLDAARGLYRLHNTEVRSRVHGSITSSKFLVAKDFTVKLGGFELAKTETSLKRSDIKESESSCYETPQKLNDINYEYTKECEIYSFGIVLWEIATRKIPFKDMSVKQIRTKVSDKEWRESIPDCPEPLKKVINECRAVDPFHRPSAGVLVDKLQVVVAQLEEQ